MTEMFSAEQKFLFSYINYVLLGLVRVFINYNNCLSLFSGNAFIDFV
jgi:hypothetical protein